MPQLKWLPAEQEPDFPNTRLALEEPAGLLAVGGDLTENWLLTAYERGIFPWYSEGEPIMWWSPAPRMVLKPGSARINRSLRKHYRQQNLTIFANRAFKDVIRYCADESIRQEGTWITEEMQEAYCALHQRGWAHSIEVYSGDSLIGGLYGVGIGSVFYGESMFSLQSNASKYAFITLSEWASESDMAVIDCQLHNPYLESLGANLIGRSEFEKTLPQHRTRLNLQQTQDLTDLLTRRFSKPTNE